VKGHASAGASAAQVLTGMVEPKLDARELPAASNVEGDWLCAWCHNRIANERDRFQYEGKDEFTFANPEGICFEIITFSQISGCRETGEPILEHTWFPGHAWSFCQCDECGQHLGWFYAGPHNFVGLIKSRIVRALYVRN
jgi:hypothetical protein